MSNNFKYLPDTLTEQAAGERFAELMAGKLVCYNKVFYMWMDGRWREVSDTTVRGAAIEYIKAMTAEAASAEFSSEEQRKAAISFVFRMETSSHSFALTAITQARINKDFKNGIPLPFDADPNIINTPDGEINLPTGRMSKHDPKHFNTKMTECSPSDNGADLWRDMLERVTGGDKELQEYLQTICGLAMFGRLHEEKLFVVYGQARTGKSTFFDAIAKTLGDYSVGVSPDVFLNTGKSIGASLASLEGARMVLTGELAEGMGLNTAVLKRVCSTGKLTVEKKFQSPHDVIPSWSVFMYSNRLPTVGVGDDGTWRRLSIIPFVHEMPTGKADIKNYSDLLADEAGGAIMKWLVAGAKKVHANNYHIETPASVINMTDAYIRSQNIVRNFILDCCRYGEQATDTGAGELYSACVKYCRLQDVKISRPTFNKEMTVLENDPDFRDDDGEQMFHSISHSRKITYRNLELIHVNFQPR